MAEVGESSPSPRRCRKPRTIEVAVTAEHLDVFDQPDDRAYITGRVSRGDHLHVRLDRPAETGWLAIEPLPTSILWIEESAWTSKDDRVAATVEKGAAPGAPDLGRVVHEPGSVVSPRTCGRAIRWPGFPVLGKEILPGGTLVQLVDRPPLELGQGTERSAGSRSFPLRTRHFSFTPTGSAGRARSGQYRSRPRSAHRYEEPRSARGREPVLPARNRQVGPLSWPRRCRGGNGPSGRDVPADRRQPAASPVAFRNRPGRLPGPAQAGGRPC